jgi:dihydroorotate dehydrogenase
MTVYRWLFDHALVRVDAETAHRAGFGALRAARPVLSRVTTARSRRSDSRSGGSGVTTPRSSGSAAPRGVVHAMGIDFPGVLGLAAGFDKNAEGIDALGALGFGFVEVGTVTGEPQPGNPRPRLFRLPRDRAVVNRMGFNNDGAEVVAERLAKRRVKGRTGVVVGVNIGKTKAVPEGDADAVIRDYEKSTRLLAPYADYLVVNVSSPNTPGLRDLQSTERLRPLLEAVRRTADSVTGGPDAEHSRRVPLLVKIAPDLADTDVLAVADLAVELGLDGIVATNTTISRDGLASNAAEVERAGAGGLSGAPLRARALEVLRLLRDRVGPDLTIIGVGGIGNAADARERLDAGATLLQAYTAFVYEGAGWPRRVQRELAAR